MMHRHTALNLAVIAAGTTLALNPKIRRRDPITSATLLAAAVMLCAFISMLAIIPTTWSEANPDEPRQMGMWDEEDSRNPEDIYRGIQIFTCFIMFNNIWILSFILREMPLTERPARTKPARLKPDQQPATPFS